jgi:mono/diheme cytochrome c family protein
MVRSPIIALTLSLTLVPAGVARSEEPATPDPAKIEKGAKVYAAQHCMLCHAIAGKGNKANSLDGVGAKRKEEEIKKYIVSPKSMKPDSKMKAYPSLPAEELDALVAYLSSLKKASP